ncbi:hypothetical protein ACFX2I_027164 [Malus domestica]
MASGFGESTNVPPQSVSCSGNNANDVGDFECNICFELAQDPIITRCGHLFCWPCLYRWLHHHSNSQECPFCKALIEEEKLVPLYGRGKTQTDPRSKSYPGINIPNRPSGQRPPTAPPPNTNQFANYGFGFMGGFVPMATQRIGNFTLATAFGGLLPSLLNVQYHGFPDATVYGTTSGFPFAPFNSFHGGHGHGFVQPENHQWQPADVWKYFFLFIGVFVIMAVIFGSVFIFDPLLPLIAVSALLVYEEWVSTPSCKTTPTPNLPEPIPEHHHPDDLKVMLVADLLLLGSDSGYFNLLFRDYCRKPSTFR